MKYVFTLLVLVLTISIVNSQTVPQGINYQGVLRDVSGNAIKNQRVLIKVNIQNEDQRNIFYSELHEAKVSPEGIFNIVIGRGSPTLNAFIDVPWGSDNLWIEVMFNIDQKDDKWESSGAMQLLSVPYALYAEKAGQIDSQDTPEKSSLLDGTYAFWTLQGNNIGQFSPAPTVTTQQLLDNPEIFPNFLGTLGSSPLVLKVGGRTNAFFAPRSGDFHMLREAFFYHDVNVTGNLTVDANAIIGENAFIGNDIQVGNDGFIGNNFQITNDLSVGNNGLIGQNLIVNQNLEVGNNGSITTDLDIGNDINISNNGFVGNNFTISNNLNVSNDGTIDNDLHIGNNAWIDNNMRIDNELSVGGNAIFENDLLVGGNTIFENDLRVNRDISIGRDALIENNLAVLNDMEVDGSSFFKDQVTISESSLVSEDPFSGALVVEGGVGISENLNVAGSMKSNTIDISGSSTDFVATMTNSTSSGSGLSIKLGRNHPLWTGSQYNNVETPWVQQVNTQIGTIKGWITGSSFQPQDLLNLFPATIKAGMAATIVNVVTEELNNLMDLPARIGPFNFPSITVVPEIDIGVTSIGPYGISSFQLIPQITVVPSLPQIPVSTIGLPTFNMPTISFTNVPNSLRNQNEYIKFLDQGDRQVGTIRAQSIVEWELSFLDGVFFTNILADLVGIDFVSGSYGLIKAFTNVTDGYNKIGVEFVSGHGDYAEWLPRIDAKEHIAAGDIVGIKGGKITKNLDGAEQILAVSEKPIILGNVPEEDKEYLGNNVAFLGQIPVKIIGSVSSGDYIVAKGDVPGYGLPVKSEDLTLEDIPLIVGRSWENQASNGPKMINTIIGLNKNDLVHILSKELKKIDDLEARVSVMEKTLDLLDSRKQVQVYNSVSNQSKSK